MRKTLLAAIGIAINWITLTKLNGDMAIDVDIAPPDTQNCFHARDIVKVHLLAMSALFFAERVAGSASKKASEGDTLRHLLNVAGRVVDHINSCQDPKKTRLAKARAMLIAITSLAKAALSDNDSAATTHISIALGSMKMVASIYGFPSRDLDKILSDNEKAEEV